MESNTATTQDTWSHETVIKLLGTDRVRISEQEMVALMRATEGQDRHAEYAFGPGGCALIINANNRWALEEIAIMRSAASKQQEGK